MTAPLVVNLCIVVPAGDLSTLGFLDQAMYIKYQLERLDTEVHISKNRLMHAAANVVLGAHLGFDATCFETHACLLMNLEQLGPDGKPVTDAYLSLLRRHAVVDYDTRHPVIYGKTPGEVPLLSFGHAPYLQGEAATPLETRPIDLLFFGALNPRRLAWLQRVESTGHSVTLFDRPLFGPERDDFIRQAKAVLNVHFYESGCFEQARAFHCLSLGTPIISERSARTRAPAGYDDAVTWLAPESIEAFFSQRFDTPAWHADVRAQLQAFARFDPAHPYQALRAACERALAAHRSRGADAPRTVRRLHIGSGKDYRTGWFNVDILAGALPDAVVDLARPLPDSALVDSPYFGPALLQADEVETVYANNVLEHVGDLPALMSNLLRLMKVGAEMLIEVPYEHAQSAWQDPTHVRAMNENSWIYYTEWFWYLGWFDSRFEVRHFSYLDLQLKDCQREQAAFMRVVLRKVQTTPHERNKARLLRPDFGPTPPTAPWSRQSAAPEVQRAA